ncbi:lectin-like domain-containing protein, partial [Lacticaseibacillus camelliae]
MNNREIKVHFKMYKAGRQWLVAGIAAFGLGIGISTVGGQSVSAATNDAAVTATQQVPDQVASAASEAPSAAAAQTDSASSSATDSTSSAAPAASSAAPLTATSAASKAATPDAAPTQKAFVDATSADPTTDGSQSAAPSSDAATSDAATDDSENKNLDGSSKTLDANFKANGNASIATSADDQSAIVTLTPDLENQSGNLTLNTQIDLDYDFDMDATINVSKGDGVSIGFHTGSTDQVGQKGGSLGFATLPGAFGWKADTYYNGGVGQDDDRNPAGVPYFGADPKGMAAFGAFVNTDANGVTIDTDAHSAKQIDSSYTGLHVHYDAASHTLKVTLTRPQGVSDDWWQTVIPANTLTWTENISDFIPADHLVSFFIGASTGDAHSAQTFKLNSFHYNAVGTLNVDFVDKDNTNNVVGQAAIKGKLNHSVTIQETTPYRDALQKVTDQGYSLVDPGAKTTQIITSSNETHVVVYVQKAYSATVKFVDGTTGNEIQKAKQITGKTGEVNGLDDVNKAIADIEQRGYVLDKDDIPDGFTFALEDDGKTFTVSFKHGKSESTAITTRTIEYTINGKKDGAPESDVQTVNWTITTDDVTGKITSATPSSNYAEVTPSLDGYTPDKTTVPEETPKLTL